jgi:hypothetical protein
MGTKTQHEVTKHFLNVVQNNEAKIPTENLPSLIVFHIVECCNINVFKFENFQVFLHSH